MSWDGKTYEGGINMAGHDKTNEVRINMAGHDKTYEGRINMAGHDKTYEGESIKRDSCISHYLYPCYISLKNKDMFLGKKKS